MLEIDADDSSDAEDTETQVSKYDLEQSFQQFKNSRATTAYLATHDPEGYSFLMYAIGVQLLYCDSVNTLYQEKKNTLPETKLETPEAKIREWFKRSIQHTVGSVFSVTRQERLSQTLLNGFLEQNAAYIEAKISAWFSPQSLHYLFKQTLSAQTTLKTQEYLSEIEIQLKKYVGTLDLSLVEFEHAPFFQLDYFLVNLNTHIENFLKQKQLMRTNGRFALKDQWPKNIQAVTPIEQLIVAEANTHFGKSTHTIGDISIAFKTNLFIQILATEIAKGPNSIIETDQGKYRIKSGKREEDLNASAIAFLFDERAKEHYLPCSHARTLNEINPRLNTTFICATFIQELRKLKSSMKIKLQRGTLDQQHTFDSPHSHSFLANLRLNMRDKRRRIRQAIDDEERKTTHGEIFQAAWRLTNQPYQALERQEITSGGARNDMVVNLETYSAINVELNNFKRDINHELKAPFAVTDSLIALWLRDILIHGKPTTVIVHMGHPPETNTFKFEIIPMRFQKAFLKFLVNFTYLLFGCESQRNPASLITHQMMLDLIQAKELSWEKAIANSAFRETHGGGEMPMSIGKYIKGVDAEGKTKKGAGKAVPAARALQSRYGLFALKPWNYDGEAASESPKNEESKSISELLRRENEIVKKWLIFKKLDNKTVSEKIQAIQTQIMYYWYPAPTSSVTPSKTKG